MAKVLVVDDSVSVRKVVERALAARRLDVILAGSAEEAIQRIDADEPDLVICDVILPDKDGYHVCEHVRRHRRLGTVPVLLISGIVNNSVLQRAAEVQSSDVMFKPFAADDLLRKIDGLLAPAKTPRVDAPPPPARPAPAVEPPPRPSWPASTLESPPRPSRPTSTLEPPSRPASALEAPPPGRPASAVEAPTPPARPAAVAEPPKVAVRHGAPAPGVTACLDQLMAVGGVRGAALADRDGLLIEAAGELEVPAEAAAALASCLAESSDGLGHELGRGGLTGMMLEYESGTLVLHVVGSSAMLVVLVDGPTVLGKVRYYAKKALPELSRALSSEVFACRA
jgi:CheY-like chemotaxis protein